MESHDSTLERVKAVIGRSLGIEDRVDELDAGTPLFGSIPELDSLAVLSLATSLEDEFGIEMDDEDFTGEIFETVGSLTQYVASRTA
jgi:acyl carrier protein